MCMHVVRLCGRTIQNLSGVEGFSGDIPFTDGRTNGHGTPHDSKDCAIHIESRGERKEGMSPLTACLSKLVQ